VISGKKVVVVLPAYKAEKTLEKTFNEIPLDLVDAVLMVDDNSNDKTVAVAKELGLKVFLHKKNMGYGANQKTCYREAIEEGADIVVMLHPDYQYDPRLVSAMAGMVASGIYDVVLASRILCSSPLKGGMPFYKYVANRFLTCFQNILLGAKISEYHTGYRAFSIKTLKELPLLVNSDDFIFDNQILTQTIAFNYRIGEISCPTKYFPEASSINLKRSIKYGIGVLITSLSFRLWKLGLNKSRLFQPSDTAKICRKYYKELPTNNSIENE
jgi:glycosyltransferase involved in cell wall biosynthesis